MADLTFSYPVNSSPVTTLLDTSQLFNKNFRETNISPIDTFFNKSQELIRILPLPANWDFVLARLVVLGFVSAIESYFREVIRKTILFDDISKNACQYKQLSYAAACIHDKFMLPEAILEEYSFAGKKNILASLTDFLKFPNGAPADIELVLKQFDQLCQLRHCIVHRFGKLGAKNAIQLGIDSHSTLVEKPLELDYSSIQNIIQISHNTVKVINNYIFQHLLQRLLLQNNKPAANTTWTWDFRKDKKLFSPYYYTFNSSKFAVSGNTELKAYCEYRNFYKQITTPKPSKKKKK